VTDRHTDRPDRQSCHNSTRDL